MSKEKSKTPILDKMAKTDPNWIDDGDGYKVEGKLELTKEEATEACDEINEKYKNFKPGQTTE